MIVKGSRIFTAMGAWLLIVGASASAMNSQPSVTCEVAPCGFRIDGGDLELKFGQDRIKCAETTGHGWFGRDGTGLTRLRFTGCREDATPFGFSCVDSSSGAGVTETAFGADHLMAAAGPLGLLLSKLRDTASDFGPTETGRLGTHLMAARGSPQLLLSDLRLRMRCAGLVEVMVEGYFAAEIDSEQCGKATREHRLPVTLFAHGGRASGSLFDVYVNGEEENYELSSRWRFHFDQQATFIC